MPVNSTHPAYDLNHETWQRIRDVIAGDAAIKRGGEKYMPRLDSQSNAEYQAYIGRGFFYNATARSVSGYLGLIYRKDPILELPQKSAGGRAQALSHLMHSPSDQKNFKKTARLP